MVQIETKIVNGQSLQGVRIQAPGGAGHPDMLVLLCEKGYIMCGYLNTETAEKLGDAAAVISGATLDDLLKNPVKAVTPEAAKLGIAEGMSGEEAVARLSE